LKKKTLGILFYFKKNEKMGGKQPFRSCYNEKSTLRARSLEFLGKKLTGASPGSILFLLSEKYLGKKVILLKITNSGLFVVTGPFLTNGVPLRRVHPRYTFPTGAKINLEKLNLSYLNDIYFRTLSQFKKKEDVTCSHRLRQIFVDRFIISRIKKNFFLNAYLKTNLIFSSFLE